MNWDEDNNFSTVRVNSRSSNRWMGRPSRGYKGKSTVLCTSPHLVSTLGHPRTFHILLLKSPSPVQVVSRGRDSADRVYYLVTPLSKTLPVPPLTILHWIHILESESKEPFIQIRVMNYQDQNFWQCLSSP